METPSIDEYKELRKAIDSLEDGMGKYFTNALIASVALITGAAALLTKAEPGTPLYGNTLVAYCFMAPPLIAISVLYLLASHRRGIHRIASYIEVFYEDNNSGLAWERRLEEFRKIIHTGESLDVIPAAFWVVQILSLALYWISLRMISPVHLCNLVTPLIEILLLAIGHFRYSNAIKLRVDYKKTWLTLKENEFNKKSTT